MTIEKIGSWKFPNIAPFMSVRFTVHGDGESTNKAITLKKANKEAITLYKKFVEALENLESKPNPTEIHVSDRDETPREENTDHAIINLLPIKKLPKAKPIQLSWWQKLRGVSVSESETIKPVIKTVQGIAVCVASNDVELEVLADASRAELDLYVIMCMMKKFNMTLIHCGQSHLSIL